MLEKIAAIIEDIFEYDASKVTEETNTEEEDIYSVVNVKDLEIYITMRRAK